MGSCENLTRYWIMYASAERHRQRLWLGWRSKPPKSQHVIIFKTIEKNQLWFIREREDGIIWILEKFIFKVLEWEPCEAEKNERKRHLENIHTLGSVIVFVCRYIRKAIDNDETCFGATNVYWRRPLFYSDKGSNCFFQGKVTHLMTSCFH